MIDHKAYVRRKAQLTLAACLLVLGPTMPAQAEGMKRSDGSLTEIAAMRPGDQLVLTGHSGTFGFAGHAITLAGFTGLLGYASDVAYVVAIDGSASAGDQMAKRGRVMILPPFGEKPSVARFDARRLTASWQETEKSEFADVYATLGSIAKSQSRGVFLGSLGRTNFNVAASGMASQELARRSIVGGNLAQEMRFSNITGDEDVSNKVVTRFLRGLFEGNVASVAQLMDPLPFGLTDMRGDPGEARLIAAQRLIYAHNWTLILKDAAPQSNPETGVWTIAGTSPVEITLRNSVDLPFIKSIRIGG